MHQTHLPLVYLQEAGDADAAKEIAASIFKFITAKESAAEGNKEAIDLQAQKAAIFAQEAQDKDRMQQLKTELAMALGMLENLKNSSSVHAAEMMQHQEAMEALKDELERTYHIYVLSPSGKVLGSNQHGWKATGMATEEQLNGKGFVSKVVAEEGRGAVLEAMERSLGGEPQVGVRMPLHRQDIVLTGHITQRVVGEVAGTVISAVLRSDDTHEVRWVVGGSRGQMGRGWFTRSDG